MTDTSEKTPTKEMSHMGEEDQDLLLEDQLVLEGLDMRDINLIIKAETHPGEGTRPIGGKTRQEGKNPSVKIVTGHARQTGVRSTQGASVANVRPASRSERSP